MMPVSKKTLSKNLRGLARATRLAGYHTLSVSWGVLTGRNWQWSFLKERHIQTGHPITTREWENCAHLSIGLSLMGHIVGGVTLLTLGSVGPLVILPYYTACIAMAAYKLKKTESGKVLRQVNAQAQRVRLTRDATKGQYLLSLKP